ncbi:hypothetical protein ACOMHN_046931 [Nucella lapillus]
MPRLQSEGLQKDTGPGKTSGQNTVHRRRCSSAVFPKETTHRIKQLPCVFYHSSVGQNKDRYNTNYS